MELTDWDSIRTINVHTHVDLHLNRLQTRVACNCVFITGVHRYAFGNFKKTIEKYIYKLEYKG